MEENRKHILYIESCDGVKPMDKVWKGEKAVRVMYVGLEGDKMYGLACVSVGE